MQSFLMWLFHDSFLIKRTPCFDFIPIFKKKFLLQIQPPNAVTLFDLVSRLTRNVWNASRENKWNASKTKAVLKLCTSTKYNWLKKKLLTPWPPIRRPEVESTWFTPNEMTGLINPNKHGRWNENSRKEKWMKVSLAF